MGPTSKAGSTWSRSAAGYSPTIQTDPTKPVGVHYRVGSPYRLDEFYRPAHQAIYDAITELFTKGQPADMVMVSDALGRTGDLGRIGGAAYLHTLVSSVPTAASASYYAEIVHDKSVLRKLVTAGTRIAQWGYAGEGDVEQLRLVAQEAGCHESRFVGVNRG